MKNPLATAAATTASLIACFSVSCAPMAQQNVLQQTTGGVSISPDGAKIGGTYAGTGRTYNNRGYRPQSTTAPAQRSLIDQVFGGVSIGPDGVKLRADYAGAGRTYGGRRGIVTPYPLRLPGLQ